MRSSHEPSGAEGGDRRARRVTHVIDGLRAGGNERQCVELLKGLSAAHGDLDNLLVVLSDETYYGGLSGVPNVYVVHAARRFRQDVRIVRELYRACRGFGPEVLVAYDPLSALCAMLVARSLRARFVNAMIQDAPGRLPWKLRLRRLLTFPPADAIVANSAAGLRAYGVSGDKGRVIRNGFDVGRLNGLRRQQEIRERFGLGDRVVVGMVAGFSRLKDQPTFIRAARQILETRRDVVFVMVGDGETQAACRRAVAPRDRDSIRFLGRQEDVESIVNVFSVGVLATFTEGISNAIMEYMALGKPVVVTRCGGTSELVVEGSTGVLVEPGDARGLAGWILRLIEEPELGRRLGEAGRERIVREFGLQRLVSAHRRLYDELMASNRRRSETPSWISGWRGRHES